MFVNGKEVLLENEITVSEFLSEKELNRDRVVVEINKKICIKEDFDYVTLKEDDEIEIIAFVGGG
ncbi:MAG: sulfur carrier protein ThiS [Clostridium sp.]|uniref:sulfur carrier protein ThiS n=1 Tax=Clostridium sp. TaxID=1506 RepID=UPI003F37E3FA